MPMRTLRFLSVVALVALCAAPGAEAASIVLRTGVDGALTPLPQNAVDPFWSIKIGGGPVTSAEVVNDEVTCCEMEEVEAGVARWISDPSVTDGSENTGWGTGNSNLVIASRSFDLTGFDLSTVSMTGEWRVADWRLGIYINGNLVGGTNTGVGVPGWQDNQAFFAGLGFFINGVNTIEMHGTSVNSQFDAFWMDAAVTGDLLQQEPAPVPEPGTLALFGAGALLAARRIRRSR